MTKGLVLQLSNDATLSLKHKFATVDERNSEVLVSGGRTTRSVVEEEESSASEAPSGGCAELPVILLDPMRLTGYQPADEDHAQAMIQSLRTVLFGTAAQGLLLYKEDQRLLDLFASQKARHGVATDTGKNRWNYLEIPYPDCLRTNLSTRLVWTELQDQRHEIAVVDRILRHLASCHQPLLWKYDMKREIQAIVDQEMSFRELQEWKVRRAAELDQLYLVRETFAHRVELAQVAETSLLKERDRTMVESMKERPGLTSFDLHSTVFSFPDNTDDRQIMGFTANDDDLYFGKEEEDLCDEDDDDEEGYSWSQRRVNQRLAFIERAHTEQLREATLVEDRVREECTTTALRVAMAKVSALKKKLEEVDGLLESLQEEQWAETEALDDDPEGQQAEDEYPAPRDSVLTLILAMVLGASDLSRESLMTEHTSIVAEWELFFGRLPPLPKQRSTQEEERKRLGLVENDAGSWDDGQSLETPDEESTNDEWSGYD
jgi:hypothetical protein